MVADQPSVFISYAHEDKPLAQGIANALSDRGCTVWIDEGELKVGDSLINRIATAVLDAEFCLALISEASVDSDWCQKELSLAITNGLNREGSYVLPLRFGEVPMPAEIKDIFYLSVDPGNVEDVVDKVVAAIDDHRQENHGGDEHAGSGEDIASGPEPALDPGIRIIGVDSDGVGKPRKDGTRGSALYRVPLKLSKTPSAEWAELFKQTWDHPPRYTTMHRPGIASVEGNTIVLDGTDMEEIERYHADTLRLVIPKVNQLVGEIEAEKKAEAERKKREAAEHAEKVDEVAARLSFEEPVSDPSLLPEQSELLQELIGAYRGADPDRPLIRVTREQSRHGSRVFVHGKQRRELIQRQPFQDFEQLRSEGYLKQVRKDKSGTVFALTPKALN